MNILEARPFVANFVSGDYDPRGYETFLEWVENASAEELDLITREYEAMHADWELGEGPSAAWMLQMEERLDRSDRRVVVPMIRPKRRMIWIAAASLLLLSAGAYLWHAYEATPIKQGLSGKTAAIFDTRLSVPRGGQRQLLLADGSKVWLNSGSTLKYPAVFAGGERVVELSGEAYFEIAKNGADPFRVNAGDIQIAVLGTHFNVKAYDDELTQATVLEGSVEVNKGSRSVVLRPGDQVVADRPPAGNGDAFTINRGVDPELVLAWKNGYLDFDRADLQSFLREVSRCYDVDIQYEGKIPDKHFSGKLSRRGSIDTIYHLLDSQKVHYKIQGKTIIIMP